MASSREKRATDAPRCRVDARSNVRDNLGHLLDLIEHHRQVERVRESAQVGPESLGDFRILVQAIGAALHGMLRDRQRGPQP